jgi:hypothetical protein
MFWVFFIFFKTQFAYSGEAYKIDDKYSGGPYLVYDCQLKHFACVSEVDNKHCIEERNQAIQRKLEIYPCANLTKFKDKKECLEKNYLVINENKLKKFCYSNSLKH